MRRERLAQITALVNEAYLRRIATLYAFGKHSPRIQSGPDETVEPEPLSMEPCGRRYRTSARQRRAAPIKSPATRTKLGLS